MKLASLSRPSWPDASFSTYPVVYKLPCRDFYVLGPNGSPSDRTSAQQLNSRGMASITGLLAQSLLIEHHG